MFGSVVPDIAIGLSFAYFLMSIVASAASEMLAQVKSRRDSTLREGVAALLGDPTSQGLAKKVLGAPFWFQTLSRPAPLRATGKKPGESH